ncbi:MAG: hypothetical protein UZ17_ACD001002907 [Acidobacteria bacterium OLB17]|nr:MAG: hypothetical protein UZ17_ACD001002907 [Acidobacteria bacterium OLB17]MCZ2391602.1 hypothetical protein [Acidobacteriota bacterium]
MKIMKIVLLATVVLLSIFSSEAQHISSGTLVQPCGVALKDAPALRGYRLGMNIGDVRGDFITRRASRSTEDYLKAEFDDSTYYLTFENKKLKVIAIFFKTLRFENLDLFVAHLNKMLNLPGAWKKQSSEQIEIERRIPELEKELLTLAALRELMLQLHGTNCREAKKLGKEIPKLILARAKLEEKRQIGQRLACDGFSVIAFIDSSIEKNVPAITLFTSDPENDLTLRP